MADLDRKVKNAVRKAFQKAGTLAKDVIFVSKQNTGFDFNSLAVQNQTSTQFPVKVIISDAKREKNTDETSMNSQKKKLEFIAEDVPSMDSYDEVLIAGVTWKIVHPVVNDGYVVTVNITKEG